MLEKYCSFNVLSFVMTNLISSDCRDYREVRQPGKADTEKRLMQQQNSSAAFLQTASNACWAGFFSAISSSSVENNNDPTRVIALKLS